MKQLTLLFFIFCWPLLLFSQGQYTYKLASFNISLDADTSILGPLQRTSLYARLSDFEKGFLYSLNYARAKPSVFLKEAVEPYLASYPNLKSVYGASLSDELKVGEPVNALRIHEVLFKLARAHASDLGVHDLMSHRSSTGATTQQRYERAGITCGSECINMIAGNVSPLEVLLSLLIDYNVPDFGHRKSLLNARMTSVGVGLSKGTDGKLQYTVVDLGCM